MKKRKLCSHFVPHALTTEQLQQQVSHANDFMEMIENDPDFVDLMVGPKSVRVKKLRFQKSKIKTMLIQFFDCKRVTHKEYVPEGQRVTKEFYLEVLGYLLK